ncbi:MAG TPA: hypothetical protein VF453_08390 [Burkholderiaceae bacterium]
MTRGATPKAKRKPSAEVEKTPQRRTAVVVECRSVADNYPAVARTLSRPEVSAAATIEKWQPDTHDVNDLASELAAQVSAVNSGDLGRAEAMLIAQAHTLNEVFNNLLRRAMNQTGLPQWEAYMRMGMKAQSQCRTTLEALAEIKNPRAVAFVRQANIAHGPQQVNNAAPTASPDQYMQAGSGAQKQENEPSKLLEQQHGQWLDAGAQSSASGADKAVAPLGTRDGSRIGRR